MKQILCTICACKDKQNYEPHHLTVQLKNEFQGQGIQFSDRVFNPQHASMQTHINMHTQMNTKINFSVNTQELALKLKFVFRSCEGHFTLKH